MTDQSEKDTTPSLPDFFTQDAWMQTAKPLDGETFKRVAAYSGGQVYAISSKGNLYYWDTSRLAAVPPVYSDDDPPTATPVEGTQNLVAIAAFGDLQVATADSSGNVYLLTAKTSFADSSTITVQKVLSAQSPVPDRLAVWQEYNTEKTLITKIMATPADNSSLLTYTVGSGTQWTKTTAANTTYYAPAALSASLPTDTPTYTDNWQSYLRREPSASDTNTYSYTIVNSANIGSPSKPYSEPVAANLSSDNAPQNLLNAIYVPAWDSDHAIAMATTDITVSSQKNLYWMQTTFRSADSLDNGLLPTIAITDYSVGLYGGAFWLLDSDGNLNRVFESPPWLNGCTITSANALSSTPVTLNAVTLDTLEVYGGPIANWSYQAAPAEPTEWQIQLTGLTELSVGAPGQTGSGTPLFPYLNQQATALISYILEDGTQVYLAPLASDEATMVNENVVMGLTADPTQAYLRLRAIGNTQYPAAQNVFNAATGKTVCNLDVPEPGLSLLGYRAMDPALRALQQNCVAIEPAVLQEGAYWMLTSGPAPSDTDDQGSESDHSLTVPAYNFPTEAPDSLLWSKVNTGTATLQQVTGYDATQAFGLDNKGNVWQLLGTGGPTEVNSSGDIQGIRPMMPKTADGSFGYYYSGFFGQAYFPTTSGGHTWGNRPSAEMSWWAGVLVQPDNYNSTPAAAASNFPGVLCFADNAQGESQLIFYTTLQSAAKNRWLDPNFPAGLGDRSDDFYFGDTCLGVWDDNVSEIVVYYSYLQTSESGDTTLWVNTASHTFNTVYEPAIQLPQLVSSVAAIQPVYAELSGSSTGMDSMTAVCNLRQGHIFSEPDNLWLQLPGGNNLQTVSCLTDGTYLALGRDGYAYQWNRPQVQVTVGSGSDIYLQPYLATAGTRAYQLKWADVSSEDDTSSSPPVWNLWYKATSQSSVYDIMLAPEFTDAPIGIDDDSPREIVDPYVSITRWPGGSEQGSPMNTYANGSGYQMRLIVVSGDITSSSFTGMIATTNGGQFLWSPGAASDSVTAMGSGDIPSSGIQILTFTQSASDSDSPDTVGIETAACKSPQTDAAAERAVTSRVSPRLADIARPVERSPDTVVYYSISWTSGGQTYYLNSDTTTGALAWTAASSAPSTAVWDIVQHSASGFPDNPPGTDITTYYVALYPKGANDNVLKPVAGTIATDIDPKQPFDVIESNTDTGFFYLITQGKLGSASLTGVLVNEAAGMALQAQVGTEDAPVFGGVIGPGSPTTLTLTQVDS